MKNIKKYLKMYIRLSAQSLKTLMEYKIDFFIGLSGFIVTQAIGIFTLNVIFDKIPSINGWTYNQVLFIYAFSQIPRGLDHLVTDNLWILSNRLIVRSEFDRYLLRPINPLFNLISEKFQTDAFGELIIGIILLVYSMPKLQMSFSILDIVIFIILIICGTLIYSSIKLLFSSLAFWFKTSDGILNVSYSLSDFSKYPISIYPKIIRVIISYVVPFAFTAYYPAAYFINKSAVASCVGGTILVTILAVIISLFVWNKGIDLYESSGN